MIDATSLDFKPQNGDIGFWNESFGRGNGHVALLTGKTINGKVDTIGQNYSGQFRGSDGKWYTSPIEEDFMPKSGLFLVIRPIELGEKVQKEYTKLPNAPYTGGVSGPGTTSIPYPGETLSPADLQKEIDKVEWGNYISVYPGPNFGYSAPVKWKAHPNTWDSTETQANGEIKKNFGLTVNYDDSDIYYAGLGLDAEFLNPNVQVSDLIQRTKNSMDKEGWKTVQDYGVKSGVSLPNGVKDATEWEIDTLDPFNNKVVHFKYDIFQAIAYDNSKYFIATSSVTYVENPLQVKQELSALYDVFVSKIRIV